MRLATISLASLLGLFAVSSNASEILQFEGYAPPGSLVNVSTSTPYSEAGFTLTPTNSDSAVFDAADPNAAFPGDSTSWFGFAAGNTITMTGPAPFNLLGFDVGPISFGSGTTDVTVTADLFGGGTESTIFSGLTTDTTETLNWTGLQDVQFSADTDTGLDNINVQAPSTPEPGTVLLFGAGLGALSLVRRRSRSAWPS